MRVEDFDYDLPADRIADRPCAERSAARLMVLDRSGGEPRDARFSDLLGYLRAGDLLVRNDSKVIPARLHGLRAGGGKAEVLLVRREGGASGSEEWSCLARPGRRLRRGERVELPGPLEGEWLDAEEDGLRRIRLRGPRPVLEVLEAHGEVPLPPYIERGADERDRDRYQTVYARSPGAVAAPTAGLHFTAELFEQLRAGGVEIHSLTLDVGPGTFLPVRSATVAGHHMLAEAVEIPAATAAAVRQARRDGRRIVAVGTTTVRALEGALDPQPSPADEPSVDAVRRDVSLFIYPGYRFRWIDGLITNFHLPRSTLLMLVAAFAGRDRVIAAYRAAIARGYRFYSYGDAMLIA